jgi:hypothetical protein
MLEPRSIAKVALKVLLAAVLIGAVFGIAGRSLAPSMPLATWLLWCSAVVGAFLVVSVLWAAVNLYLRQWVVRHGGRGPQVFWFNYGREDSVTRAEAAAARGRPNP